MVFFVIDLGLIGLKMC